MLTRQGYLARDALLELEQTIRVEIQTVVIVTQFVAGFAELNSRLFKHIQHARELAVHTDELGHQLPGSVELALQVGFFAICEHRQRVLTGGQQLAAVGQTFVLFIDLFELTRLWIELIQLFQLILQQVGAGCAFLALLLMLGQLAAALMPLAVVFSHTLSKRILTGITIEQRFLVFWLR